MKLLIFGATGMLGSVLAKDATKLGHEVFGLKHAECDVTKEDDVLGLCSDCKDFDLIINAAGQIHDTGDYYLANSLGALHIAKAANLFDIRLLHISTDCVFSGKPSPWHSITEVPDPVDMYGVSKRFGEIAVHYVMPQAMIIRTSFIGNKHGLMDWFLGLPTNSKVDGYDSAIWSGSSVYEVSRKLLADVIHMYHPGIEHLAIPIPMTKYEVLKELRDNFRPDITVDRVKYPPIYRALQPSIVMDDVRVVMKELAQNIK